MLKQISRSEFVPDACEIFARHKAVFRRPEKQVSGIWLSGINNAVVNLG